MDSHLRIGSDFDQAFGRRPLALGHGLADHELLTVEAIAALAGQPSRRPIEHNLGNLARGRPGPATSSAAPQLVPRRDRPRRSRPTATGWCSKNIERDRRYNGPATRPSTRSSRTSPPGRAGCSEREGFIFLSGARTR